VSVEGREARIRRLLPLVKKIARRIRSLVPGVEMDDLIGDGSIGLIRAVDQFDGERGPTLEHYARRLIAGAMLNGLRRMDPVSERSRRIVRDVEDHRYALAVERGSLPTLAEMDRLRPMFKRAYIAAHHGTPLSLDAPLPEGEAYVPDWSGDPAAIVLARAHRRYVGEMLDGLPARERALMRGHYFAEQSLRAVGAKMGISPQRASQLHVSAIRRLRKAMHAAPH
jgi:RNA polymerase sigma factor for flagellar operon FliA